MAKQSEQILEEHIQAPSKLRHILGTFISRKCIAI